MTGPVCQLNLQVFRLGARDDLLLGNDIPNISPRLNYRSIKYVCILDTLASTIDYNQSFSKLNRTDLSHSCA